MAGQSTPIARSSAIQGGVIAVKIEDFRLQIESIRTVPHFRPLLVEVGL
jgi:hypothetical protein